jgi:hypothetical protein
MDDAEHTTQNEYAKELQKCLSDAKDTLARFVVEAPQAVLMDCYTTEYTATIIKVRSLHTHGVTKAAVYSGDTTAFELQNLQSRVTDLQGQISRLNAEKLRAQEDAAVACAVRGDYEQELENLEHELQNLRSASSICTTGLLW